MLLPLKADTRNTTRPCAFYAETYIFTKPIFRCTNLSVKCLQQSFYLMAVNAGRCSIQLLDYFECILSFSCNTMYFHDSLSGFAVCRCLSSNCLSITTAALPVARLVVNLRRAVHSGIAVTVEVPFTRETAFKATHGIAIETKRLSFFAWRLVGFTIHGLSLSIVDIAWRKKLGLIVHGDTTVAASIATVAVLDSVPICSRFLCTFSRSACSRHVDGFRGSCANFGLAVVWTVCRLRFDEALKHD